MQATTIDEVIAQFEQVIETAKQGNSRIGYFAALYYRITTAVKQGIQQNQFQDGPRMERFDVAFANRYFDALTAYQESKPLAATWRTVFQATSSPTPTLIQHLIAGFSAHIFLDLGVAAAQICPGDSIKELRSDYDTINQVLEVIAFRAKKKGGTSWKIFRPLGSLMSRLGGAISQLDILGIEKARERAWDTAIRFAHLDDSQKADALTALDQEVMVSIQRILKPVWPMRVILRIIGILNRKSTLQMIDAILIF